MRPRDRYRTLVRLNEVALPSAAATDASRVVISSRAHSGQPTGTESAVFLTSVLFPSSYNSNPITTRLQAAFVQTPQSKVPRHETFSPRLRLCAPGHFRLSHSVYRE